MPHRPATASTAADRLDASRLRVRFRAGEPAYGLFARLAARNIETSSRAFARRHGLRFDVDIVGGHAIPQVARLAGLPETDVARHTVTRVGRLWVVLHGEHLRSGLWWPARTFCPKCLRGDLKGNDKDDGPRETRPFRRAWWDVRLFKHCPLHRVRLASRCPGCGKGLSIDQPSPWKCACSADLTTARTAEVPADDCSFERYLVGRLGGAERVAVPMLDKLPLMAAEELAYHLGRMAADDTTNCAPETPHRSSFRSAGFAKLKQDDADVLDLLSDLARTRHVATVRDLIPAVRAGLSPVHAPALDALASSVSGGRPGSPRSMVRIPLARHRPGGSKRPAKLARKPFDPGRREVLTLEEAAAFCCAGLPLFRCVVTARLIEVERHGRAAQVRTRDCIAFMDRYATSPWLAWRYGKGGKGLLRLLRDRGLRPLLSGAGYGFVFDRRAVENVLGVPPETGDVRGNEGANGGDA